MKNIGICQSFQDFIVVGDKYGDTWWFMITLRPVNTLFIFSEGDKKKNDVEVKIDKFDKKDKKKTLCRLEIKKVWLSSWIAVFFSLSIKVWKSSYQSSH